MVLTVWQIVTIYVHLDRGDSQGVFARAISSDGRSYRDEVRLLSWGVFIITCILQKYVIVD
jgi:hypothetical protein